MKPFLRLFFSLILGLGLIVSLQAASTAETAVVMPQPVHPLVFQMMECWWSDTTYPVVTEVNLDAVNRNRNQFDHARVSLVDGEYRYRSNNGEQLSYRILDQKGNQTTVLFADNGGGTLTMQYRVTYEIKTRPLAVDGCETRVRILRVTDFASLNQH